MAIIKIEDLPREQEISDEERKRVMGGGIDVSPFKYRLMDPGDDGKFRQLLSDRLNLGDIGATPIHLP